jgi:NAD(P)-dependent dehydrogenase (short-subunit alcohol dehydrogenase family)
MRTQGRHPRGTAGIGLASALVCPREGAELTMLDRDREAAARAVAYTVDGGSVFH